MIRKMLVLAAAVAMPAAALAGVTAVSGSGIASAKAEPPTAINCSLTGTVTFAKPGLSNQGAITSKSVETTKSAITASGTGCSTKAISTKINSTTSPCWSTLPTYTSKTVYTGGVLNTGAAGACDVGGMAAASDTNLSTASIKSAIKAPDYYDTAASFVSSGASDIGASFPDGIAFSDNGTKVSLAVTTVGVVLPGPGGACDSGAEVGFSLSGNVNASGTTTQLSDTNGPLTYSLLLCLGTDGDTVSGTQGTGTFYSDFISMLGGNTAISIQVANADSAFSSLVVSD
jgi:hypothetical protein